MGELVGLPEWLARTLFVVLFLTAFLTYGFYAIRKAHRRVANRRPNPTRAEFVQIMSAACSSEATDFLWDKALTYVAPRLTPHPDDDLRDDLRIDDDDWGMDWPREWAEQRGFHESNLPNWPKDWRPTIRNYGRWLSMGPVT